MTKKKSPTNRADRSSKPPRAEGGEAWTVRCCDFMHPDFGLASLESFDHVMVDPPYSARTHKGHNAQRAGDGKKRGKIQYDPWTPKEVGVACQLFAKAKGWVVTMTDHVLALEWDECLTEQGLCAFAPLPYFAPGSRTRQRGDGPSSWTIWIMAARQRSADMASWGTLPGGYVRQPTWSKPVMQGGKPLQLMQAIVRDYSHPGDIIVDPCMGAGTTGAAAVMMGRRFVGWEQNVDAFEIAIEQLKRAEAQYVLPGIARPTTKPVQGVNEAVAEATVFRKDLETPT